MIESRGGMTNRPGSHFVAKTKFTPDDVTIPGNALVRLVPFAFSNSQSYMMEFGNFYMRFYRNNGVVEDVGAISTYLGDGSSTRFIYPHAGTDPNDIEVYDGDGNLVDPSNYTATTINNSQNYMPAFSDIAWNKDYNNTGAPWTVNVSAVDAPRDEETVLSFDNAQIPIGGTYFWSVDISNSLHYLTTISDSDPAVVPLTSGADWVKIGSALAQETIDGSVEFDYSLTIEDTGNNSRFDWEFRQNANVLHTSFREGVSTAETVTVNAITAATITAGDEFSLWVKALQNNPSSVPQINGGVSPTTISGTYQPDPDAEIQYQVKTPGSLDDWRAFDSSNGTQTLLNTTESNNYPSPLDLQIRCRWGLTVTLDNPVFNVTTPGVIVTFNSAPAQGAIILLRDGTVPLPSENPGQQVNPDLSPDNPLYPEDAPPESPGSQPGTQGTNPFDPLRGLDSRKLYAENEPGVQQAITPFEVQSPFSADELYELYWAQVNDQMWFCHPNHKPWLLTRFNAYDWRWTQPTYTGAPWEDPGYAAALGYPQCVAFFGNRLWFSTTYEKPQTLWASRADDFYEFTIPSGESADPVLPDSPLEYTLATYTHEAITWLSSERVLVIGTSSTEHRLAPDGFLSTDRIVQVSKMTDFGGYHTMPVHIGGMTAFVQTAQRQLRSFEQKTNTIIEDYESVDLGWMSEHMFNGDIREPCYALYPYAYGGVVRDDGAMLCFTFDPTVNVFESGSSIGWTLWYTDGFYMSASVIPTITKDQMWTVTLRDVNGTPQQHIEYRVETSALDSKLRYDGVETTQLFGLEHLEGKVVSIVTDKGVHPDQIVSGGAIPLQWPVIAAEVGIGFTPTVQIMPYEGGNPSGTSMGKQKRWPKLWVSMFESGHPLINGKRAPERNPETLMNEFETTETGLVKHHNLGWDVNGQIEISQDLPIRFHVLGIFGDYTMGQG